MKIAKESWVIMAIGLADLITTIIFIEHHGAEEANPLFRRYWEMGLMAFILAKLALLVGPLWVLEWARKRNPAFVSWALRSAIAGYLIMYGIGFVRLNSPAAHADEVVVASAPAPDSIVAQYNAHKGDKRSFRHRRPKPEFDAVFRPDGTLFRPMPPHFGRPTLSPVGMMQSPPPITY